MADVVNKIQKLSISVCTFQNGSFDVILSDPDTGEEVTLSGEQKLDEEQFNFVNDKAPACVMTTYTREAK
jgi:hypothetical protein